MFSNTIQGIKMDFMMLSMRVRGFWMKVKLGVTGRADTLKTQAIDELKDVEQWYMEERAKLEARIQQLRQSLKEKL